MEETRPQGETRLIICCHLHCSWQLSSVERWVSSCALWRMQLRYFFFSLRCMRHTFTDPQHTHTHRQLCAACEDHTQPKSRLESHKQTRILTNPSSKHFSTVLWIVIATWLRFSECTGWSVDFITSHLHFLSPHVIMTFLLPMYGNILVNFLFLFLLQKTEGLFSSAVT